MSDIVFSVMEIKGSEEMITACKNSFDEAVCQLGEISTALYNIPRRIRDNALELRLRTGKNAVVETRDERYEISDMRIDGATLDKCMQNICHFSLHSFEKELSEGYITLKGGHRVGFCGSAVNKNGAFSTVDEISSLNLRIANQIIGCAIGLEHIVFRADFRGMLIIGPPMSGKTTILRDLCRIVGNCRKASVIDSRNEIAAVYDRVPQNDVGKNTDVLSGYDKGGGIITAVRVMSPEYVFCDEITGETASVSECVNCGVKPVFTAHFSDIGEAVELPLCKSLSHIVRLGYGRELGKIMDIYTL